MSASSNTLVPIQGRCRVEALLPRDLIDAILSLPKSSVGNGIHWMARGEGHEQQLNWAIEEITQARLSPGNVKRHSTQAVFNARRALDCLVTWYLDRDAFSHCKNAPRESPPKAAILKRRGIIDDLTESVLSRAISARNTAEHGYTSIGLEEAEDIVDLIRRTIQALIASNSPMLGYGVLGSFSYASSTFEPKAQFFGWKNPFILFPFMPQHPWLDIVLPESESLATVRRIAVNKLTVSEWHEAIEAMESRFGAKVWSGSSVQTLEGLLSPMGIPE